MNDLFGAMGLGKFKEVAATSREFLEKAKAAELGDIHEWKKGKYQKTEAGWKSVPDDSSEGRSFRDMSLEDKKSLQEHVSSWAAGMAEDMKAALSTGAEAAVNGGKAKKAVEIYTTPKGKYFDARTPSRRVKLLQGMTKEDQLIASSVGVPEKHVVRNIDRIKEIDGRIAAVTREWNYALRLGGDNWTSKDMDRVVSEFGKRSADEKRGYDSDEVDYRSAKRMIDMANAITDPKKLMTRANALENKNYHSAVGVFRNRGALLLAEKNKLGTASPAESYEALAAAAEIKLPGITDDTFKMVAEARNVGDVELAGKRIHSESSKHPDLHYGPKSKNLGVGLWSLKLFVSEGGKPGDVQYDRAIKNIQRAAKELQEEMKSV